MIFLCFLALTFEMSLGSDQTLLDLPDTEQNGFVFPQDREKEVSADPFLASLPLDSSVLFHQTQSRSGYRYPVARVQDWDNFGIPRAALVRAFYFYNYSPNVTNRRYVTIVDFTRSSKSKRMFVLDFKYRTIARYLVAHGINSGYGSRVESLSNEVGSKQSAQGIYLTAEPYDSPKFGMGLRLDGMESTNFNSRERNIVFHGSDYVRPGYVGHSEGCFAVDDAVAYDLILRIRRGSVLYAHWH